MSKFRPLTYYVNICYTGALEDVEAMLRSLPHIAEIEGFTQDEVNELLRNALIAVCREVIALRG